MALAVGLVIAVMQITDTDITETVTLVLIAFLYHRSVSKRPYLDNLCRR